jgi:Zn-dependent peptidase ImmA (M78 family)
MKDSTNLPDPIIAAEEILAKAKITNPPVDLTKIVSIWSNLYVVEQELDGSGYLLPIGDLGAEILINIDDREERKRFTVAHELGHWVLGLSLKTEVGHFTQPKDLPRVETERWCDTFAANILMPEFMVQASVPQTDPLVTLNSITAAASRFKVSEEAFFIRLWETLRFQVALVTPNRLPSGKGFSLRRNFAGKEEGLALEKLLGQRAVIEQLESSPFPVLSFVNSGGRIRCAGRKLTEDRLILILKWPESSRR